MRNLRTMRILAPLLLATIALSACSEQEQSAVRPLVDLEGVTLNVAEYDDESLQERLEKLLEETKPIARKAGGWGKLTTDLLNPELTDIVFTGADRATLNFGYGTEATSVLSRGEGADAEVIFVMAGDTGSCWGIRFKGDINRPSIRRSNKFAPNCYANELADLPESRWTEKWPPTAEPTGNVTVQDPSGRAGSGLPPSGAPADGTTTETTEAP